MSKLLVVDASHLYWTHYHATADQELSAAYERSIGTIYKIRDGYDFTVIACDGPPYLRKETYPAYKQNREAKPPAALEQLDRVKRRCEADGLLVLQCRGFESDDLFATICELLRGTEHTITLGTNDKDCLQCVEDPRVRVLHPLTGDIYTREKVIEKFGVAPDMMGDLIALMGDASDNIPGVPGVGPKTAAKLLLQYGSLTDVLANVLDIPQDKLRANLLEHAPAVRLARRLVELRADAPIDVAEIFKNREARKLVETDMEESLDALGPEVGLNAQQRANLGMPEQAPSASQNAMQSLTPEPAAIVKVKSELATYEGPEFDRGLEPATLDAAWRLAGGIFNSRLYGKFPNREAVWAVMVRGREMGLGALTALDCFHVIEGKPALSAHLIIARAKQHPECEYFQLVETTAERAEYVCKRRSNPEPTRMSYTIEQARKAGVARGNWDKRPDEMLRKTAGVQLARAEFPEAALGLYAIEELSPDLGE